MSYNQLKLVGHWARHTLLHMAAECVNHSATKPGPTNVSYNQLKLIAQFYPRDFWWLTYIVMHWS